MSASSLNPALRRLAVLGLLLLAPLAARADDLDIGVRNTVNEGQKPALLLEAHKPIKQLSVELESEQGRKVSFRRKSLPLDRETEVVLPQAAGKTHWSGKLTVVFADGTEGEMPLAFDTLVRGQMRITSRATRDDVLGRKASITVDRSVEKVVVEVTGDDGRHLGTTEIPFGGTPPGEPITLEWKQEEGKPLKVGVEVTDVDGLTGGLYWLPWEVYIPHQEVVFDSGSDVVRKDQAPKLQAVLTDLNAAFDKYGELVEVSLWIAGYTDTVGPAKANQRLSDLRARAIGRWFRRNGVKVPIYYRGFGEEALAVATPDETDEVRNRRADYVVAGEDPFAGQALPGRWQRLR